MKFKKIYFITKIGTNDRICLTGENKPLIIDNVDDAQLYAEYYTRKEKEKQLKRPSGYMALSVQDFFEKYGYYESDA